MYIFENRKMQLKRTKSFFVKSIKKSIKMFYFSLHNWKHIIHYYNHLKKRKIIKLELYSTACASCMIANISFFFFRWAHFCFYCLRESNRKFQVFLISIFSEKLKLFMLKVDHSCIWCISYMVENFTYSLNKI